MTDKSIDISGLSPEKKRALLSQLLMAEAEESASAHPMSYGQRSMWFIHKLAPTSAAYNVTYAGRISGELDVPALERAAQALVDRHPTLRTTYAERDGQPVQLVHPHWPVRIARHHLGSGEPGVDEWIRRETDRPFDLYTGPVLRLTLLERTPEEHVLLLGLHHIAVDFWSIDVILDELRLLYAAEHGAAPPRRPRKASSTMPTSRPACSRVPKATTSGPIGVSSWPANCRSSNCPPTGPDRPSRPTPAPCTGSPSTTR